MKLIYLIAISIFPLLLSTLFAQEEDRFEEPLSVAVMNFDEKGDQVKDMGEKVSLLLGAMMSAQDGLLIVERADLETSLGELELSLSGTVSNESAAQIGQITGAKAIVTGRVFPVGKQNYIVAKVIGVETSRVFGETAKFISEDELDGAVMGLSEKIGQIVVDKRESLVADVETEEEFLERLKEVIGDKGKGVKVYVSVSEEHLSQVIPDPAVETEMLMVFEKLGYDITEEQSEAAIRIIGEAFSERAAQRGQLISCRARAEIKHFDNSDELVSVDRQTEVAVDLAENVAAKSALQKIGLILAERMIKRLAR